MRILALDSATEFCSVAFGDGHKEISRGREAPRKHADLLLPLVHEVLQEAECELSELDAIAVGQGPGSFTGVRIAAGVAQGLAFSQDLPLVGVSNLAMLAQQAFRVLAADRVITAIDARMGEVYYGTWLQQGGLMQEQAPVCVCAPEQVPLPSAGDWLGVGTGFVTYARPLAQRLTASRWRNASAQVRLPAAQDMLPLARARLAAGAGGPAENFEVEYVRNEVTWQKLPGRG